MVRGVRKYHVIVVPKIHVHVLAPDVFFHGRRVLDRCDRLHGVRGMNGESGKRSGEPGRAVREYSTHWCVDDAGADGDGEGGR